MVILPKQLTRSRVPTAEGNVVHGCEKPLASGVESKGSDDTGEFGNQAAATRVQIPQAEANPSRSVLSRCQRLAIWGENNLPNVVLDVPGQQVPALPGPGVP